MELARVFLGIEPDPDLRARLGALLPVGARPARDPGVGARPARDSLRWTSTNDLHITLVFIGAAPAGLIAALHTRIAALAPGLARFRYELHGPQLFPDARHPRVLALVPEETSRFAGWQQPLATVCVELGCKPENRPYRPHLSLARLRRPPAPSIAPVHGLRGTAREIVLFESRGGHYQPLFRVRCAGTGSRAGHARAAEPSA